MRFLFIGNSHTFRNDMPRIFQQVCQENGIPAEVTMLAHSGKTFEFHSEQPEVRFNILYGNYDYIILQDRQKDFSPDAALKFGTAIDEIIRQTTSKKILYMTWTIPQERAIQNEVAQGYYRLGQAINAPVAPVGLLWWEYADRHPDEALFVEDNRHATPTGSALAAYTIFQTIFNRPPRAIMAEHTNIVDLVTVRMAAYKPEDFI